MLDFNLYMSPKDVFAFAVIPDANAMARPLLQVTPAVLFQPLEHPMVISGTATENADGSTTRTQPFSNYQFTGDADSSVERSLTGHVEVIEMGVVSDETYAAAATHDSTGVPADCAALDTARRQAPGQETLPLASALRQAGCLAWLTIST